MLLSVALCSPQTLRPCFQELVPCRELRHYIAQCCGLSESGARFYAASMLVALDHLHSKAIIHRDMKPENIMVDEWVSTPMRTNGVVVRSSLMSLPHVLRCASSLT